MEKKQCRRCKSTYSTEMFYKQSRNRDGLFNICKQCLKSDYKTRKVNGMNTLDYQNEYQANKKPAKKLLASTKGSAAVRNISHDITVEDIENIMVTRCPYFGLELVYDAKSYHPGSASVDRINPHLGYTPDNIEIISRKANMIKQDLTPSQLKMFAKRVLDRFE